MRERLKTFALVALVTGLIWLWAESESLSTDDLTARIEFVQSPDVAVKVDDAAWSGLVEVRMRGPTAALDRARRTLGLGTPLKLTPGAGGVPATEGTQEVDMGAVLRASPEFRGIAVSFERIEPPTVRIVVEPLRAVEVPVTLKFATLDGLPPDLEGEPRVEPGVVTVRGPSQLMAKLEGEKALGVQAVVDADQIARLRDPQPQTLSARVVLPDALAGNSRVTVSPARVAATVTPLAATDTWVVPTIPIKVSLPPGELDRWTVQLDEPFVRIVSITGPRNIIRAMRERGETPTAYLDLTVEDLNGRIKSKAVTFSQVPTPLRFSVQGAGGPGTNGNGSSEVPVRIVPREGSVEPRGDSGAKPQ